MAWWRILLKIVALLVGMVIGTKLYDVTTTPNDRHIVSFDRRVVAGDVLHMTYNIKRHWKGCRLSIDRYLWASSGAPGATRTRIAHEERDISEDSATIQANAVVPETVPPGTYVYYTEIRFTCNFAQRLLGPTLDVTDGVFVDVLPRKDD